MNVVGVSLVALPYAIAKLIVRSKIVRVSAILSLVAYASTRYYRRGEGPFTPKMTIQIAPGIGMGAILFTLINSMETLKDQRGRILRLTRSEATSLGTIIQAVVDSPTAMPVLEDWLHNFQR